MKRLAKALRYAAAAAVCVLAATTAVDAAVAKQVRLVHVMYRHGARNALVGHNQSLICRDTPCGELNPAGVAMMTKTGEFLRTRYSDDAAVVDAPLLSETYQPHEVYTRSTNEGRTLQTAGAVLNAMFPASAGNLMPVIRTNENPTDWALNPTAPPSVLFFYNFQVEPYMSASNAAVDAAYPDWTELQAIADDVYSGGACRDYKKRGECGIIVSDIAASFIPTGQDAGKPRVRENHDKLRAITATTFDHLANYNKSQEDHLRQGSRAQPFLQEMLQNIDSAVKGHMTYKMLHYSAHDIGLVGMWSGFGDTSTHGLVPPYGQTMITELLQDTTDKSYHVRVLRGHPGQTPESNFDFALDDTWKMRCVGADGAMYEAEDNTCPLDDFKRTVEWSKPTAAEGMCYLNAATQKVVVCPNDVAAGQEHNGGSVGSACSYYRQQCPDFACRSGCVLNSTTLQCVCRGFRDDKQPGLKGGAVAGIAVGTFFAGVIVAACAALLVFRCLRRDEDLQCPTNPLAHGKLEPEGSSTCS